MQCTSCGVKIGSSGSWVEFACPSCTKERIVRCSRCKKIVNSYKCKSCEFVGP